MSADVPRPPGRGQDPPARHLRLVSPSPEPTPRKRQRRPPTPFTIEEQNRIRAAMRGARRTWGTWQTLADAMGLNATYLIHVVDSRPVHADMAIRLAKLLRVPVESLYAPPSDASCCPTCGARRGP